MKRRLWSLLLAGLLVLTVSGGAWAAVYPLGDTGLAVDIADEKVVWYQDMSPADPLFADDPALYDEVMDFLYDADTYMCIYDADANGNVVNSIYIDLGTDVFSQELGFLQHVDLEGQEEEEFLLSLYGGEAGVIQFGTTFWRPVGDLMFAVNDATWTDDNSMAYLATTVVDGNYLIAVAYGYAPGDEVSASHKEALLEVVDGIFILDDSSWTTAGAAWHNGAHNGSGWDNGAYDGYGSGWDNGAYSDYGSGWNEGAYDGYGSDWGNDAYQGYGFGWDNGSAIGPAVAWVFLVLVLLVLVIVIINAVNNHRRQVRGERLQLVPPPPYSDAVGGAGGTMAPAYAEDTQTEGASMRQDRGANGMPLANEADEEASVRSAEPSAEEVGEDGPLAAPSAVEVGKDSPLVAPSAAEFGEDSPLAAPSAAEVGEDSPLVAPSAEEIGKDSPSAEGMPGTAGQELSTEQKMALERFSAEMSLLNQLIQDGTITPEVGEARKEELIAKYARSHGAGR